MAAMTYRDALRQALDDAMNEDQSIVVMGEEVGRYVWGLWCHQGPDQNPRAGAADRYADFRTGHYRRSGRRCNDGLETGLPNSCISTFSA